MKQLPFALFFSLMFITTALADDSDWKLVFQDDFERTEVGAGWLDAKGLSIVDGRMRMIGVVVAQINYHFTPDVRVEYDGWALEGVHPCDMSVTLCGAGGNDWGYLLGFGAQWNHANHLFGPGVRFEDKQPPFVIEHGKKYHCVAQKEGNQISYTVNGTVLFDVKAVDPVGGPGFDIAGILAWTGMEIDNVKAYDRITPHPDTPRLLQAIPDGPLNRDGRKIIIRNGASTPALESAVTVFNQGNLDEALKQFRAMGGTLAGLLGQAYVLGDLGYVEKYKHPEFEGLAKDFDGAVKAHPEDKALADYALMAGWFSHFRMQRNAEASVAAKRFRALGPNNNPFYYKARFYQARYHYWNGAEGGDQAMMQEARDWMAELKKLWPDNSILKQYTGEPVSWGEHLNADTAKHPAWAAYLREAYAREIEFMHHFISERQDDKGGFGGGYGDDCEMMRTWMQIAAISSAAEKARTGIENLAQGIWDNELKDGFATGMSDVEHAAEPSADMLPGLLLVRYGDPLWVERNLRSCKTIKDTYMGLDANGYPRFKASIYGGGKIETTVMGGGDSGYNGRPMKHFIWESWRGNPEAKDWYVRWADGWRDLTMKEIDGKIPGVIPCNVWYPSGSITAPVEGAKWWDPKLNYITRSDMIVDVFLAAYLFTQDPKFIKPFQLGMEMGSLGPVSNRPSHPEGSREWQIDSMIGYSGNMSTEQCKTAVYHWLTGDTAYNDFIKAYGDPVQIYYADGNLDAFMQSFKAAAVGLRANLDIQTTEVLSTDRCGLPYALSVFGAYTGAQSGMRDAETPSFSITYDTPSTDFAALVTQATTRRLQVWLYNFTDQPMPIGLKLWRLEPGQYILNQGEQIGGERASIHRYKWEPSQTVKIVRRAEGPVIMVPPGKVWGVDLRLDEPIEVPKLAPDLAVAQRDIVKTDNGLEITVHNIGSADAKPFPVAVQVREGDDWKTIASQECRGLGWPRDLTASTAKVEIPVKEPFVKETLRVLLDPEDKQFDLNEKNNACVVE